MEKTIVMSATIASSVCFIAIIVLLVVRAKRNGTYRGKKLAAKIGTVFLSLFLAVMVVCNFVVYRFSNVINQYFSTIDLDDPDVQEVRNAGLELTEEIEDEGIVLLKNENDTLPLSEKKVNVFGYTSIDINFGGTGSGGAKDTTNISLYQGLKNAGIETNSELETLYEENYHSKEDVNVMAMTGGDYNNYEPSADIYTDEIIDSAKEFSDTALVVLTRNGGEGSDLPLDTADYEGGAAGQHYLELNQNEKDMLAVVEKNFSNVVIIINSSNAMELGFVDDDAVDAAIWVGGPGSTGCNSIGKVLTGEVNPSGRLADTYAYDATSAPSYNNFGDFVYENTDNKYSLIFSNPAVFDEDHYMYVDYAEGIYIGYRYYETRWVDNETGECDEEAYHAAVQYPFGYGLSYTDFTQEIEDFEDDGENIIMKVKVTNTGDTAGKDVVQVYYTAPYYVGGIEKSHVNLINYGKTELLQPGESDTIEISFKYEDMASYDYEENCSYVLEHGKYEIKLMNNSHDVIDSRSVTVNEDVIYNEDNAGARSSDETTAVNHFDDVSTGNDVKYVSRADWEGTIPTERAQNKEATDEIIEAVESREVDSAGETEDIVVKDHGLTLDDMKGLDYDDPKWDELLEQISVDEMENLISFGGYATQEIDSIDKTQTSDQDGPAGINSLVSGNVKGIQYPSEVVIASTWNQDLAEKYGKVLGNEASVYGVSGLYAPAMNNHRSPFSGRNFEYYSEDGVLAGKTAAAFIRGAGDAGVYCYMKHFALDDQESNRLGLCVWSTEQAMREIYLKPFEISVKEGNVTAVMASDSRLGTTWCGESSELLNNVLRDEWGFDGMVITDYVTDNYKNADNAIQNGCDLMLTTTGQNLSKSADSIDGRQAMRRATHNILYTVANSNAQEISKADFPTWTFLLIGADVIIFAAGLAIILKITAKKK